jgi:hypothetical protein
MKKFLKDLHWSEIVLISAILFVALLWAITPATK